MTEARKRTGRKLTLAIVVAVVLVGVFAATAGAQVFGGTAADVFGEVPPDGAPPAPPAGEPGNLPQPPLPPLSEEQQAILDRAATIAEEAADIVDEASIASLAGDWAGTEALLQGYVAKLQELEGAVDEFLATFPAAPAEGTTPPESTVPPGVTPPDGLTPPAPRPGLRPVPPRAYLEPVLRMATPIPALAEISGVLPDANRATVKTAVEAAANASDHPAFWGALARLVGGTARPDPARLRERLELELQRAQQNLERTNQQIARLNERIVRLEERIGAATNAERKADLQDAKHLTELELGVCQARLARDEFATEVLKEKLAELPAATDGTTEGDAGSPGDAPLTPLLELGTGF